MEKFIAAMREFKNPKIENPKFVRLYYFILFEDSHVLSPWQVFYEITPTSPVELIAAK